MKNLKINVPSGYEIDTEKSTFENIVFRTVSKNIREEIQTMEDVFRLNGTSTEEFYAKWDGHQKHDMANAREKLIVAAYNEGKLPNWSDQKERKYYPYFNMDSFSFYVSFYYFTTCYLASRLCFIGDNAEKNLEDAVNKFLPEYRESRLS